MNIDQSTNPQDPTPKLSTFSSTIETTKSFLSQVRNSSATKSSGSQQYDSFDPECLSPLDVFSSNPASLSKEIDSSHKSHLAQKLKVKVYNYFQEKNDTPYYPVSEGETPGYSISTSVETPQYIESAQLKPEGEGSIVRQSSENDVSSQDGEENNGTLNLDNSEIRNHWQTETNLVQVEQLQESQPVSNNVPVFTGDENGGPRANQPANGLGTENNHFMESLEFVLEKTPIITIFMALICLALTSGITISIIDGKETHTFLFIVLYVFLLYFMIQNIFKMFRDCGTPNPSMSLLLRGEAFYNVLDNAALIVIAAVVDLKLCEVIHSLDIGLYTLIMVFSLYCACAQLSFKEKAYGSLKRFFYIGQFLALMYKMDNHLSLSWHFVLCSGWILLGYLFVKLVNGIYSIVKAFSGLNIVSAISKSAKFIGLMGLAFVGVDLIVLMMILGGVCQVLDSGSDNFHFIKFWLTVCQYLNACLLFFTTITAADLLEFILSVAEHFNPRPTVVVKPKEIVMSIKETYVMRTSTTYYKIVEEGEIMKRENEKNKEVFEDNICYICCGNNANGVVLDCGHGGTCHECLSDYIQKKDECMECRKKVNSILKIDSEVEGGKVFKGSEVWSIVRK